ncbi:MAG: FG-GAP-like repeat-containing protein, partial [Luteitalea sp.]
MTSRRGRLTLLVALSAALCGASCSSCRRQADLPPAVYREAVTTFYTALAAIDTSQEVLGRQRLDRFVTIAPQEPAGWANLGLLLLRQQDVPAAREHLDKAAALAPDSGAIVRLQALVESRAGNLAESTQLWRRALALDPGDVRSAYALAQEIERQGGAEQDAEAQRVLAALLARTENLAVRLDYARLAAKRGDAEALAQALAPLGAASATWPAAARDRLTALRTTAVANPRAAATHVAFLRNLLARDVAYRGALANVSTPLDAIGEPLSRFVLLPTPAAMPAPADTSLTFAVTPQTGWPAGMTWVGAIVLDATAAESLAAGGASGVFTAPDRAVGGAPNGRRHGAGPDAIVAADLDYDFRTDLVLTGPRGLTLLRQGDTGRFADVTRAAALPTDVADAPMRAAWAADIDADGDLDLVVAPEAGPGLVLRNNGDSTFARQQPFGPCDDLRGFAWADLDGEGVPDAVCLGGDGRLQVFLNRRGGAFEPLTLPAPAPTLSAIVAAEVTGDSRLDLVGVSASGALTALTLAEPAAAPGQHTPAPPQWAWRRLGTDPVPLPDLSPGVTRLLAADLDNNAAVNLVIAGPTASRVLLGGAGTFVALPAPLAMSARAAADLDGDGRLELIGRSPDGAVQVARSRGRAAYHWQRVRTRAASATGDQRVNAFGIGGQVEARSGLHVQRHPISSPIVHMGLGDATRAEVLRITWPNGVLQSEFDQQADVTVAASQRLKGSCPWLFAWNGREMAFVTDLIWRSPLGLRINAEATADVSMTEDWVRVGGQQLRPRDGSYDLRITAELWETHFFDLVSLAVVDHPAGTEVFVDERFAVPAPVQRPIVTGPLQPFAAVADDQGADVRDRVVARDDRHLDFAGRGRWQGVTRRHHVEMTLPEQAPLTGPLWLVAQGWVHPTDSSINVALAQGAHEAPQGLSLEVADARGQFHVVRPRLGFPSGKDKTMLIDLAGLFAPGAPRRLRLTTNLEIFWDRLAWTVGRPDVAVTARRLPLQSADLRYRGYSAIVPHEPSVPGRPRYAVGG